MNTNDSKQEILKQLTEEIYILFRKGGGLMQMTAFDAVNSGTLPEWIDAIHDQLKAGHSVAIEKGTSKKVVELVYAFKAIS